MDGDAGRGRRGHVAARRPGWRPGGTRGGGAGLLALALELAAEGVTGRAAVLALTGAGAGRLEDMDAARVDCAALADGGYPHAATALTLLTMAVHPSAGVWWAAPKAGDRRRAPALTLRRPGTCRSARPGTPPRS